MGTHLESPERIVIALGGNAIAPAGSTSEEQLANVAAVMGPVADLVAAGIDVILTHGNGPQVGDLLVRNELTRHVLPALPLDWLVAQTQATIGYAIVVCLERELAARGLSRPVIPVLTRVVVARDDPAWEEPTKPVGPYIAHADEAQRRAAETGQQWVRAGERGWRRVVPSPEPLEILDRHAVQLLLRGGAVVVAAGGGGIPMVRHEDRLQGVEAVVDKDLAAFQLALACRASSLVILTDVPAAAVYYGTPEQQWLGEVDVQSLRALQAEGQFGAGSMGPKVEAALRFLEAGGRRAVIAGLADGAAAVAGRAGTQVVRSVQGDTHQ